MISQAYFNSSVRITLRRSFLALIVIVFFCDVAVYLSLAVSPRIQPQYWVGLLVALGAVVAWASPRQRWEVFRTPLFFWCAAFLTLTVVSFIAIPASHAEQFKEQIRTVILLTALLAVFIMLREELGFVRKLLIWAVLLGVVINLVSLFYNRFIPPPYTKFGYSPAGFYSNPNESGIALILGMILTIGILPRRWRAPFTAIVLAGVAATFSREAVLGWFVAVFFLCVFGIASWKAVVAWFAVLLLCAVAIFVILVESHLMGDGILTFYHHQVSRFYLVFMGIQHDQSATVRWDVLKLGWATFLKHPLIGNGIGSTYHWSLPYSTHNMYLLYMDDYGIIGLFLYPLLIWCMIYGATGETCRFVWTMAIFLLFWGFFDHNIVQNYYSLFAISMTAAMAKISATETAVRAEPVPVEPVSS